MCYTVYSSMGNHLSTNEILPGKSLLMGWFLLSVLVSLVGESHCAGQSYSPYKRQTHLVAPCQLKLRWQNVKTQLSGNRWAPGFF